MMIDRRMYRLTNGVRARVLIKILLGLLAIGAGVGQGLLGARILTGVFSDGDLNDVFPYLTGIAALIAAQFLIFWVRDSAGMWIAAGVKVRLRRQLFQRLLDHGPGYLAHRQTGEVQSTVVDGVEALEGYIGYYIPQAFIATIGTIAILTFLLTVDVLVGATVAVAVLVALFGGVWFARLLGEYGQRHWNAYQDLNVEFVDSMQGMTTLKAFNAAGRHRQTLHERARALYRATMAQLSISLMGTGITHFSMAAGTALAVGIAAVQLTRGAIEANELFIVLLLSAQCFQPITELNNYWHQGFMGISALSGIQKLLDDEPEVVDPPEPRQVQEVAEPAIAFDHVTFRYQPNATDAVQNLTFKVDTGQHVAVVGRSGSGKSTIVALLARFFDPQSGSIRLGRHDLRELSLAQVRSQYAVVSQDTYLFHGTVADNLRLGKPDATVEEIEHAARVAHAHEFIVHLDGGYKAMVGERGLNFSGGQRQRLAIARALLKDAPILLLDEATASVDAKNEYLIQQTLDNLVAGRTTLTIAHRLSTVVDADLILVLENGQIVERGRHKDLIERTGSYARFVSLQQEQVVS